MTGLQNLPGLIRLRWCYSFVLPVLIVCSASHAQISQPSRFELSHQRGDYPFTVVSLRENGISLIRQQSKNEGSKKNWEVLLLDSTLREAWKTEIPLDNRLNLIGYEYAAGELFYLFRHGEMNNDDLLLVRIYLFSHTIENYRVTPQLDFRLTHFTVSGHSAVLGGYIVRQPTVLLFEMSSRHLKVIPGIFVDNMELLEVKANVNKTFNILMVEHSVKEKRTLMLKTYDESGTALMEDDIEIDGDRTILAGTTSSLENEELFVAGTWSVGTSKQAAGFFYALADPFDKQPVHYVDLDQLRHFLDYLPPKRMARIKSLGEKRRQSEKPPSFRTDIHLVRLEETTRGFFLFSELFVAPSGSNFPYYNTNPYYSSSPFYSPYGYNPMLSPYNPYSTYSPYSPYGTSRRTTEITMTHASVLFFTPQGNLTDDFGMALHEIKIPTLDQFSDFYASGKVVQFYKNEEAIRAATHEHQPTMTRLDTIAIKLDSPDDNVRNEWEDQGGIRYWFGPYAFAWGYESIKNKREQSGDRLRYVYYVNKIRMD